MKHPFTGGLFHTPDELLLIVDSLSPRLLQLCVIAHEVAHVFLGHDPEEHGHDVLDDGLLASLLPALNPAVARMMLGRTYFDGDHFNPSDTGGVAPPERAAETLGRVIVGLIASGTGEEPDSLNAALRHRGTGV
ncbi:hypothetical protein ACIG3E_33535 [Streptomyces sp. NPDC053474]|uniref:hypothetical protein n=1 Tax=Streptomyces sp. NPDC053474 TaxID=3365704 RepID=UPI0037D753D9